MAQISGITAEFEAFAAEQVASGRFADARAVLEAARTSLERRRRYEEKRVNLKQAIQQGVDSGVYAGDAFADVRQEMGWSPTL